MRKVRFLVAGTLVGLVAFVCGACGSSTSNNPAGGGSDAGPGGSGNDGASSTLGDSGDAGSVTSEDAAVACVPDDADIETLNPADAALDDAGASVGTCIACAKSKCASDVTSCNGDCSCNTALVCIFDCIGGVGNSLLTCAEQCGGTSNLDSTEEALLLCAASNCKTQCATASLTGGGGGGGGGNKDASVADASDLDASDDAGTVDASDAN
jgi:hypothetical protein